MTLTLPPRMPVVAKLPEPSMVPRSYESSDHAAATCWPESSALNDCHWGCPLLVTVTAALAGSTTSMARPPSSSMSPPPLALLVDPPPWPPFELKSVPGALAAHAARQPDRHAI